ncbi:SDR family NAD(P)-dependent oxidoreductase [Parasphingopyxis lamellibrachiae]|uniref:3-oxoacyl-[acyl-carrier protein] reductase n=1 Tax=Parasphingopyxis lamellibrachiae TaxID=680125 RepID=A0A3D9FEU6_9SPHN|nr:SDR family NAD(P)-dependent oxidoreductase [Parasphingopyxis lamellibrachiae]RED16340.1 3-oxoacyl-[acyl-carrier protein] reductase [Parasphingopyxis lamellibrachiae]
MKILEGKAAAVTGGGRGIGRGHCLALAEAGAGVIVNDIDPEAAAEVVGAIEAAGGEALASDANIGSRAGAEALVEACIDRFGRIDAMVNNAGNLRDRSFLKMSDEEFDQVWTVHVKGTFWCSQIAARAMREAGQGGAIVNTTSGAHFGSFGQTNYAASKGAIASMTYTWALELARYGIRVNAIGPTGTTRMSDTFAGEKLPFVDPELNGPLVAFLASDLAKAVSGQIFGSGGERVAHMVQPHYGKTLVREGGWTIEALAEHFMRQLPGEFGALGMLGQPYPFHDGVKAPEPAA